MWLWRQAIAAIVVVLANGLREQKALALISGLIAWMIVIPWVHVTLALYLWVSRQWVNDWSNASVALFYYWHPFGGGLCLVWCAGSALSGWVSAELGRRHRATAIAATTLALIPLAVWWAWPIWCIAADYSQPLKYDVPIRIVALTVLVGMPTSVLLGGLWGAHTQKTRLH
jgi:hypothetical protein